MLISTKKLTHGPRPQKLTSSVDRCLLLLVSKWGSLSRMRIRARIRICVQLRPLSLQPPRLAPPERGDPRAPWHWGARGTCAGCAANYNHYNRGSRPRRVSAGCRWAVGLGRGPGSAELGAAVAGRRGWICLSVGHTPAEHKELHIYSNFPLTQPPKPMDSALKEAPRHGPAPQD